MANWSNPLLTSTYTNFVTEVKDRDVDLALQFDGTTSTNIPTNAIRWNSSANRWQKWSGSTWGELTSTYSLTGLTTTGRLGVGTTTPGTCVDITLASVSATIGNLRVAPNTTGQARIHVFNGGETAEWLFGQKTNTDHDFKLSKSVAGSEVDYLTVTTSGNIGIGTAAPNSALHVIGTVTVGNGTNGRLQATVDSSTGYLDSLDNTSTNWQPFVIRGTSLQLHTNTSGTAPAEKVRIDSSGRLGLGTASPGTAVDVMVSAGSATAGNIRIAPTTPGQARFHLYNGGETAEWLFGQKTNTDHDFKLSKSVAGSEVDYLTVTTTGVLKFDSGYGSVANAYGCRAWVNFNGTGTVAIRASANVSSITDNGTGDYTVNFTTAMPDANYAAVTNAVDKTASRVYIYAAGSASVLTYDTGLGDSAAVSLAVFR